MPWTLGVWNASCSRSSLSQPRRYLAAPRPNWSSFDEEETDDEWTMPEENASEWDGSIVDQAAIANDPPDE
jgi:hypothetical protein